MREMDEMLAGWRKAAERAGHLPPESLAELENHLRESTEAHLGSGLPAEEAFAKAVKQLGAAQEIAAEFEKVEERSSVPVKLVVGGGLGAAMTALAVLLPGFAEKEMGVLLGAHVAMVTLGYALTLVVGGVGICYVGQRCARTVSRARPLMRVAHRLNAAALVLTAGGLVTGMAWAQGAWGRYWGWDAREIGCVAVLLWQIGFLAVHRWGQGREHGLLVSSLTGNCVVVLAWFGANLLTSSTSYPAAGWSAVLAALAVHVALMVMACGPAGWLRSMLRAS